LLLAVHTVAATLDYDKLLRAGHNGQPRQSGHHPEKVTAAIIML